MAVHLKEQMLIEDLISQKQHVQKNDEPANNYERVNVSDQAENNFNEPETSNTEPGAHDIFEVELVKIEPRDSFGEQEVNIERNNTKHRAAKPNNQTSSSGFECDICHKIYKTRRILSAHKYTIHFPTYIECHKCNQPFPSSTRLAHHIYIVHKAEKKHACDECGAEFVTRFNLTRHVKSHAKQSVRKHGRKWELPRRNAGGRKQKHDIIL